MPVTLAEFSRGTVPDLDAHVIDEFRKANPMLNLLTFDDVVNPAGGGATWTYSYRRLVTQANAAFRAINTDYTPSEVTTAVYSTNLAPLGGTYQIDRVLASNDNTLAGENALQMEQKIKATSTKFNDAIINGDTAVDAAGFDGLSKALVGSTTEIGTTAITDWSDWDTNASSVNKALDAIDAFVGLLDGPANAIIGNRATIARVRAAARRAGQYVRTPFDGVGANNQGVYAEAYGDVVFYDAGQQAGASTDVVPIQTRTVGGTSYTGLTDLYAVRLGLDGFHGVSFAGRNLVTTILPDFTRSEAVQTGVVELGPVGIALKATKSAAVLRNIKIR